MTRDDVIAAVFATQARADGIRAALDLIPQASDALRSFIWGVVLGLAAAGVVAHGRDARAEVEAALQGISIAKGETPMKVQA